jgi:hypothetical protein
MSTVAITIESNIPQPANARMNTVAIAIEPTIAQPANTRTWKDFVPLINSSYSSWRKSVGDLIACGRHLVEAHKELSRDAFNAMVKSKLEFEASVARKLLRIAANETLCAHVNKLPPHWSTLYYLSQLSESVLKAAFADGKIHPDMMRKDAIALKPLPATAAKPKAESSPPSDLSAAWSSASPDQRRDFLDQVGCDGLCAVLSNSMRSGLHDRATSFAGASTSSNFARYATDKLHSALCVAAQSEPDLPRMAVLLGCILTRADANGLSRSSILIAAKPTGRKR